MKHVNSFTKYPNTYKSTRTALKRRHAFLFSRDYRRGVRIIVAYYKSDGFTFSYQAQNEDNAFVFIFFKYRMKTMFFSFFSSTEWRQCFCFHSFQAQNEDNVFLFIRFKHRMKTMFSFSFFSSTASFKQLLFVGDLLQLPPVVQNMGMPISRRMITRIPC
jgi:hypothetical protein